MSGTVTNMNDREQQYLPHWEAVQNKLIVTCLDQLNTRYWLTAPLRVDQETITMAPKEYFFYNPVK